MGLRGFSFNDAPCKDCENKGCGSYHDQCEMFQKFKRRREEAEKKRQKHLNICNGIIDAKHGTKGSVSKVFKSPKK